MKLAITGHTSPMGKEVYEHYKKINDNVGIPIIIYNIPSRSVIDMSVNTMSKLYELKNIVGVKDATGDLSRVDQQLKAMGKDFIQLTGNDDNALEFNRRGGVGAISVTANIAPKLCSQFQTLSKLTDDKSIADYFNNYFSEIGKDISSKVKGTDMHFSQYLPEKTIINSLFLEPTNEREIVSITRKLKSSFSSAL